MPGYVQRLPGASASTVVVPPGCWSTSNVVVPPGCWSTSTVVVPPGCWSTSTVVVPSGCWSPIQLTSAIKTPENTGEDLVTLNQQMKEIKWNTSLHVGK
jgi:hypothetical protein